MLLIKTTCILTFWSFPAASKANGTTVVRFKDHLEIRLALFASVQVRLIDGRLSCEPRFGFIPRDRATWVTLIGLAALTATAFLDLGITPLSMLFGFLSVSSGASTAVRYQLTESCITRVQTAYMLMTANRPSVLPSAEAQRELAEPAPGMVTPRREGASVPRGKRLDVSP